MFKIKDKELLVVAGLLSVTVNQNKGDREHCASPRGYENIRGKHLILVCQLILFWYLLVLFVVKPNLNMQI